MKEEDTPSRDERVRILRMLHGVFRNNQPKEALRIEEALREMQQDNYHEVIRLLTIVERTTGLPTDFWDLLVNAKAALGGHADKFWKQALRMEGLL